MSKSLIAKDALRPFGLKIDNLDNEGVAQARSIIRGGAEAIGTTAAAKVPRKSGSTANQVRVLQEDAFGNTWAIVSRTLQGYLMQWGAKGHKIAPKTKKALRIGNVFIRGPVQHPGIKPRRWLTKSFKEIEPIIKAQLEIMLGSLIRKK